jgi:hypothetical protein
VEEAVVWVIVILAAAASLQAELVYVPPLPLSKEIEKSEDVALIVKTSPAAKDTATVELPTTRASAVDPAWMTKYVSGVDRYREVAEE